MKVWLERHSEFASHLSPTSAVWMSLTERRTGHQDAKAIRRGVLPCVADLQAVIEARSSRHGSGIPNPSCEPRPRIPRGKVRAPSPDFGADPARLHQPQP